MRYQERYACSVNSSNLTVDERTTWADSDVIGAAGMAAVQIERKAMSFEAYTTTKELSFVQKIGRHAEYKATRCDKRTLLVRYIEACAKRTQWGDIDRAAVLQFARNELANAPTEITDWARRSVAELGV